MAIDARQVWAATRFWMETENLKSRRYGGKSHHHWYALLHLMRAFERGLELTGLYGAGVRNAEELVLRELELPLPGLPPRFSGYRILHLTDLHLDGMPGLPRRVHQVIAGHEADLCVLTGDYRTELHGPIGPTIDGLRELVGGIHTREGCVAVLGNHDGCHLVAPMEALGIRLLINEHLDLRRGDDVVRLIGTDDVHYYYTDQALHALEQARDHFSIALVHSPELYDSAADQGIALYLCGHTHGGQVCLPGGRPVITHLSRGRDFVRGQWRYRDMVGITSTGVGTSGIPVRFNTRAEVLLLRLVPA